MGTCLIWEAIASVKGTPIRKVPQHFDYNDKFITFEKINSLILNVRGSG